jgi:hypothetical protein
MARLPESEAYYKTEALSHQTSAALIAEDFSPDVVESVQKELQAYFTPDHTLAGVIYHPDGKGPEKPYYRPEGNDWMPEVQAISRIGVQYDYWQKVHEGIAKQRIILMDFKSTSVLLLYPTGDGRIYIQTDSNPAYLKSYVAKTGQIYPKRVPLINYGGDADFYGSWENQIFPIPVLLPGKTKETMVQRKALGISQEQTDIAWQSWSNIWKTTGEFLHNAFLNTYTQLPGFLREIMRKEIDKGEKMTSIAAITRTFFQNNGSTEEWKLFVEDMSHELQHEATNPLLFEATRAHAENLYNLYETAKAFRADIYHY